jgi:signal peptide peptidase SppA
MKPISLDNELWLMDPAKILLLRELVAQCQAPPTAAELDAARQQAAAKQMRRTSGKVAVLEIQGMIEQRLSFWGWLMGSCPTEDVMRALGLLLASADVEAIVLDVDSPGGFIYGVEELSDYVYAARATKPIYAIANSTCCSAAYWIASAAGQLVATPGADVGSIGVFMTYEDYSANLEQEGIKITIVRTPEYKAERLGVEPLTAEARDYMQVQNDLVYGKFVKAVARNRGVAPTAVRDNYGKGRTLKADAALAAGMVDRILSFEQLLDKLGASTRDSGRGARGEGTAASLDVLQARQRQRRRRSANVCTRAEANHG